MGNYIVAIIVLTFYCWLISLWIKNYKKRKNKNKSSSVSNVKKSKISEPKPENITSHKQTTLKPYVPSDPKKEVDITIPEWKDGAQRQYWYSVKINVTDMETLTKRALAKEYLLDVKEISNEIHVFSLENDIGILVDRVDMIRDWLERGDPYFFCIEHVYPNEPEKPCTGMLAFYRDKRQGQEKREQVVIALTAYKSDEKQSNITICIAGEELNLQEDFEHEDSVIVSGSWGEIGKLPQKYAKRYLEEKAYGVFFEKAEPENDFIEKPFVRIIW